LKSDKSLIFRRPALKLPPIVLKKNAVLADISILLFFHPKLQYSAHIKAVAVYLNQYQLIPYACVEVTLRGERV
jgi:hypothetical protein